MKPAVFLVALGLVAACGQPPAAPKPAPPPAPAAAPAVIDETTQSAAGAEAFLKNIYANYYGKTEPVVPDRTRIWDKAMLELMAEDEKLSKGDIGALDYDPLCQCQDDAGIVPSLSITTFNGPTAVAAVSLDGKAVAGEPPFHDAFAASLIYEDGHWRIRDIIHAGSSLRRTIQAYNAERRSKAG